MKERVLRFLWLEETPEQRSEFKRKSVMETFLSEASGSPWHKDLGAGIQLLPTEQCIQRLPGSTWGCVEVFCAVREESSGIPPHVMWRNITGILDVCDCDDVSRNRASFN